MTAMLRIKNFERFQHYKDRSPPWIKLYTELLDDYEFSLLSDVAKAHLILLWLVASKMDNRIPCDARWLAKRVPTEQPINVDELIDAGFIEPCDDVERDAERPKWHSRYVSAAVRAEVIGRTDGKCASCGSADRIEIDHIVPISQGGTGDAGNLQALCRKCNRSKRTKSVAYTPSTSAEQSATQMRRPETETEQRQRRAETEEIPPAVAVAPRADRKPKAEPKYPHFPPDVCGRLYDKWTEVVGRFEYPRFRKAMALLFDKPADALGHTEDEVATAISCAVAWADAADRYAKRPFERGRLTPETFVQRFPQFVGYAREGMADAYGGPSAFAAYLSNAPSPLDWVAR